MNKYEIHYIQNSTSSTTHIKATDSQLAYLKFKQLNPKSTVTKLVDCETGKECPLPTKPDNTKEKKTMEDKALINHQTRTELTDGNINKIAVAISSAMQKTDTPNSSVSLKDLSILDWVSIIFKINVATLIVMAIPVGVIALVNI